MESSSRDTRFEVRDAKPEVGQGLFARQAIKEGDFILEYTGRRISTKEADESDSRYLFEIDSDWTIEGPTEINLAGFINHGCDPNVEADVEKGKDGQDHINIYALRDIAPGEELTIDYGEEYFDEFIKPVGCQCSALKHRA